MFKSFLKKLILMIFFKKNDKDRTDRSVPTGGCDRGPGQRMESSQSSPGNIGMAATRSMGVLPDLLQQHTSNTSSHQSSPQHRLQDSTTSDEVNIWHVNTNYNNLNKQKIKKTSFINVLLIKL